MKAAQFSGLLCLAAFSTLAQVHEAWVSRYNGGYTNLDHLPVAVALDSVGNVFVAGSSQSSATNADYVVLKYAPDGTQSWAARYAPPAGGATTVAAMALGRDGNTVVTGTAGTVGVGPGGAVAWVAPYAGTALAADTNGNVYVTGFPAEEFDTVKLDVAGSNTWSATFNGSSGNRAASQKVRVDGAGNLYVAGWGYIGSSWIVKYDPTGAQVWASAWVPFSELGVDVEGLAFDPSGNVYVTADHILQGFTSKITPDGQGGWRNQYDGGSALVVDGAGNAYLTGDTWVTLKLDSAYGGVAWESYLEGPDSGYISVAGMALDLATNIWLCGVYAAGYYPATDLATVKLDNNGSLLWSGLYHGPAYPNGATAIAAAPDGSIYVTGYSANTSGGSDITTIKYVQDPTIQPQAGGAILLQLPGLPGSSGGLGATTNFINWSELGPVVAGTNGLFQFTDTNATLYPYRFYRWH